LVARPLPNLAAPDFPHSIACKQQQAACQFPPAITPSINLSRSPSLPAPFCLFSFVAPPPRGYVRYKFNEVRIARLLPNLPLLDQKKRTSRQALNQPPTTLTTLGLCARHHYHLTFGVCQTRLVDWLSPARNAPNNIPETRRCSGVGWCRQREKIDWQETA